MPFIEVPVGDQIYMVPTTIGKYQIVKYVNSGAFSAVCLVLNPKTNEKFACKIVSRAMIDQRKILNRFEQELRLTQSFNHPYILKTIDVIYDDKFIYAISEYCPNGDLASYIVSIQACSERQVSRIMKQVLEGLNYLNNKKIVHRDIKPQNILLDKNMDVKICDFGLCHEVLGNQLLRTQCGSPLFAAPEVIEGKRYDGVKSDIWSLGIVCFVMALGYLPWKNGNQIDIYKQICSDDVVIPTTLSPPLQEILGKMLKREPMMRPTPNDLLAMEWFKDDYLESYANGKDQDVYRSFQHKIAKTSLKKETLVIRSGALIKSRKNTQLIIPRISRLSYTKKAL